MHNFLSFLIYLISASYVSTQENNACETFPDYYKDLEHNPKCFYNPDVNLTVPEMITRHGYPVEKYNVITQDGYILTLFRVPHDNKGLSNTTGRSPVFLQHGFGTNSVCFVDIGLKSLAFVMSDAGYDVWLGNFRGTVYSNAHQTLNYNDRKYWNFTFHELAIYDLPAQLDLVQKITGQKIIYMGHSMGTTTYFVYNSLNQTHAKKSIRMSISLSPIAFLYYTTTPYRLIAIPPIVKFLGRFLEATTDGAINTRSPESISSTKSRCLPYPIQMMICEFPKQLLFGFDQAQSDPTTLPVIILKNSDAIGVKLLVHYAQLVMYDRFQQYDYGKKENMVRYGSVTPPQYNLSNVNVPNYFIRAINDLLATKKNVEKTYAALPSSTKPFDIYVVPYKKFAHADFLLAKDVKTLVYNHIVNFLQINDDKFQ